MTETIHPTHPSPTQRKPHARRELDSHTGQALRRLEEVVASLPQHDRTNLGGWRWTVRQCLTPIRDALLNESAYPPDWLQARRTSVLRERNAILTRMGELAGDVLCNEDVDELGHALGRVTTDIRRHLQKVNDLAYDEVSLELGGSE